MINGAVTTPERRLGRVEQQLRELRAIMEKVLANSQGSAGFADVSKSTTDPSSVYEENRRLRVELDKLKTTVDQLQNKSK